MVSIALRIWDSKNGGEPRRREGANPPVCVRACAESAFRIKAVHKSAPEAQAGRFSRRLKDSIADLTSRSRTEAAPPSKPA
jgi:hypothetical protein